MEAESGRRWLARRDGDRRVSVAARGDCGVAKALLHIAVGDRGEVAAQRFDRTECGQTGVGPAAVESDMLVDERIQQLARIAGEGARRKQMVGKGALLVENPGVHSRDELLGADEVHLNGEDAEEEVSIGDSAGHGSDRVTVGKEETASRF